jgi:NADH-quinone oxidoreductase subunit J
VISTLYPTWTLYPVLALMAVAALWTLQAQILRAVIGLAAVSVLLTVLMFEMGAPLAGVFELSVCAGLITVVFVSTISLTRPYVKKQDGVARTFRFHPFILFVASVGALLWIGSYGLDVTPQVAEAPEDASQVLWSLRRLDLLGQAIVMLAGVFGVVVLFKHRGEPQDGREEGQP